MTIYSNEVTAPQYLTKQPAEKRLLGFDFTAWLRDGETISSPTVTSELVGGGTSDLTITSVGATTEVDEDDGTTHYFVTFFVEGGTHASQYRLECTVNTSLSQILEADGMLRVVDR